jgi:hypothetical protein
MGLREMARAQVPTVDPRDPDGMRKALRAIEAILQSHGDAVDLLMAQRALVPLEQVMRAPDNKPVPTSIATTFNQDGSMTVDLRWTYLQGARPSTQTVVVVKKGAAPLKPPVYWEDDVYTVPAGATYARIDLPSEHNYRFGVAAARGTPGGLEVGEVQAPTANPDWADIGGVKPVLDVPGLITGVTNNLLADVTLTEATFVSIGNMTVNIPAWATDTKVLVSGVVTIAFNPTTAGVTQMTYRVKRGATVLYTSSPLRYDTSTPFGPLLWEYKVGPWMDKTTTTGSQVYSVELNKDDITGNHAVVARGNAPGSISQTTAMHWSY